jgi:hypothetical protein
MIAPGRPAPIGSSGQGHDRLLLQCVQRPSASVRRCEGHSSTANEPDLRRPRRQPRVRPVRPQHQEDHGKITASANRPTRPRRRELLSAVAAISAEMARQNGGRRLHYLVKGSHPLREQSHANCGPNGPPMDHSHSGRSWSCLKTIDRMRVRIAAAERAGTRPTRWRTGTRTSSSPSKASSRKRSSWSFKGAGHCWSGFTSCPSDRHCSAAGPLRDFEPVNVADGS